MPHLLTPLLKTIYIPHGHCYLWQTGLVGLHVVSDALIALAYYAIAGVLTYFVQRRQDLPFKPVFWLFAAFIAACGTTHVLAIWTLWVPQYWFSGGVKAFTALISVYTAIELIPRIPAALALPNLTQLEEKNASLLQEISARKVSEATAQAFNQELERRVAERTQELEKTKNANQKLLQQEQQIRNEQEKILLQLEDTAERLNIALSAAEMGSWDWDLQQEEMYWSPKTESILGFTVGTAAASYEAWQQRVHPSDLSQVETAITTARQSQDLFSQEYRIYHADGALHWVRAQGRFVYKDEVPQRMIGVMQDITPEKKASLSLQASEARFRAVFEQAAVGVARLSMSGKWLQVNQTLLDLLGYTRDELIGQPFQAVTDSADADQDNHYYQQFIDGDIESCRFEKRYLHKNGTSIWTLVTVSLERNSDSKVVSFIAVIEDIRKLKETQIELEQRAEELQQLNGMLAMTNAMLETRNAELDQFAYVSSHDLKAPLRAIANLSEWIEEDLGDKIPAENQQQLELLRSRVHRMEALINGLLAYSRVDRRTAQISLVNVRRLLEEEIDALPIPPTFRISLPEFMPVIEANDTALIQVFSNLIVNAVKHHDRSEGHIEIAVQDQGTFVEFAVTDDGPGIEPQYHEKIFTIFQTLKARDEFESTGIGLAIVKKIVVNQGGAIAVESELGKGTTFRFTWPKHPAA